MHVPVTQHFAYLNCPASRRYDIMRTILIRSIDIFMASADSYPKQAFHDLYRDHHGWLQGWLRGKLGNSCDAADLAQDTFIRVLRREEAPVVMREPRAYLTYIARHLLVDFFRRADLERAYLADLAQAPVELHPSPEEKVIVLQALQEIDRMLAGLTAKTRAAWLYSRLDGLTHAEIATLLSVSVPRVRQYLTKASTHTYMLRFGVSKTES